MFDLLTILKAFGDWLASRLDRMLSCPHILYERSELRESFEPLTGKATKIQITTRWSTGASGDRT